MNGSTLRALSLVAIFSLAAALSPLPTAGANPCNPCAAKSNPCNPCRAAQVDRDRFVQPAGAKLATGKHSELIAEGEKLWRDPALSSTGTTSCSTCHMDGTQLMNDSFDTRYPHYVEMPAKRAGVEQVNAAEMVNFCMIVPMQDEPLAWDSRALAALAAYVEKLQAGFEPGAAKNPCNPCGN